MKISKDHLNVIIAENIFPQEFSQWYNVSSLGKKNTLQLASKCPNTIKCVNCDLYHLSRSNVCEVWEKEKEIMKIKVTRNITYLEARKMVEQTPEVPLSKIVQWAIGKPQKNC